MKARLLLATLIIGLAVATTWLFMGWERPARATSLERTAPTPGNSGIGDGKAVNATAKSIVPQANAVPAAPRFFGKNGTEIAIMARSFPRLHLASSQILLLQKDYDDLVRQREAIELRLAHRDEIKDGEVLISIPAYMPEGTELQNSFGALVVQALGDDAAKEFFAAAGSSLWTDNNYYGQRAHQILIDDTGSGYHIHQAWLGPNGRQIASASGDVGYDEVEVFAYLKALFPAPRK
jgi:hypothetical protein